jgi:hypothetical protein
MLRAAVAAALALPWAACSPEPAPRGPETFKPLPAHSPEEEELDAEAAALPEFQGLSEPPPEPPPEPAPEPPVVPGPWLQPKPDLGGLSISLGGAATMRITNARGERSGFVAGHPEALQGIPRSAFFVDGVPGRRDAITGRRMLAVVHSFHVHTADVAPFTVQVIGVSTGRFTLSADLIGPDGSTTTPTSVTGTIAPGQTKTYAVVPRGTRATISRR